MNIFKNIKDTLYNQINKYTPSISSYENTIKYLKLSNYNITEMNIDNDNTIYKLILFSHYMKCTVFIFNDTSEIENIMSWTFDDILPANILLFKNNINITENYISNCLHITFKYKNDNNYGSNDTIYNIV